MVDAAVALFCERGFSQTGLNDIVDRAGVSMGAFYYHFGSKEAIGEEIIAQAWPKAVDLLSTTVLAPGAGLEHVIELTFAITDLLKRDRVVWIANHLNLGFGQLSEEGRAGFALMAEAFIDGISACVRPEQVHEDLTQKEVGTTVLMALHGCYLLSSTMRDDVHARLIESWRVLLRALVPSFALSHFEDVVHRTAYSYANRPA